MENNITALHWSVYMNQYESAKFLIDNGAEIDAATIDEGHTPLMWASIQGNIRCIYLLLGFIFIQKKKFIF